MTSKELIELCRSKQLEQGRKDARIVLILPGQAATRRRRLFINGPMGEPLGVNPNGLGIAYEFVADEVLSKIEGKPSFKIEAFPHKPILVRKGDKKK